MRRKQLYLDEATDRELKRLARRTGRSEASHVREALDRYLKDTPAADDVARRMAALDLLFSANAPVADWEQMEREIEVGYEAGDEPGE
jgi:predicted DNA-binding protein